MRFSSEEHALLSEEGDVRQQTFPTAGRRIGDLWRTLVDVHGQVGHGGRQIMDKTCHSCAPPCDTAFRSLPDISGGKRKKSTVKIIHKPNIPETVEVRRQADLVDLQLFEDKGYKFILNYQDCFSKFIILRPLKTKTAVCWRTV